MKYKLGRKPRAFDNRILKLKNILSHLPVPPPSLDNTKGIKNFGMMLNDQLGDCTCAAVYHARQVWTANTGVEKTEPDVDVLTLYEKACGYNPNDPETDQGGIEQDVLKYLWQHGMPLADGSVDKILAYVEVNHKILDEVKLTIQEFGIAYIGFSVPQSIYNARGNLLQTWDYIPNSPILGGHAVVLVGYDNYGFTFISWGGLFKMTWAFFKAYCDEVYAICDNSWLKQGKSPLGLSVGQMESLMRQLRI